MTIKVNLNADMAEGYGAYDIGNDREILRIIGSASIACGFHAGDPLVMRRTIAESTRCVGWRSSGLQRSLGIWTSAN